MCVHVPIRGHHPSCPPSRALQPAPKVGYPVLCPQGAHAIHIRYGPYQALGHHAGLPPVHTAAVGLHKGAPHPEAKVHHPGVACTTRHDTTRHDTTTTRHGTHDTARHDTAGTRHDTTRHDTTRHDTARTTRHNTTRQGHDTTRHDRDTKKAGAQRRQGHKEGRGTKKAVVRMWRGRGAGG
jgi:hypothetical protein